LLNQLVNYSSLLNFYLWLGNLGKNLEGLQLNQGNLTKQDFFNFWRPSYFLGSLNWATCYYSGLVFYSKT